jgi:hypothetical protein
MHHALMSCRASRCWIFYVHKKHFVVDKVKMKIFYFVQVLDERESLFNTEFPCIPLFFLQDSLHVDCVVMLSGIHLFIFLSIASVQ